MRFLPQRAQRAQSREREWGRWPPYGPPARRGDVDSGFRRNDGLRNGLHVERGSSARAGDWAWYWIAAFAAMTGARAR